MRQKPSPTKIKKVMRAYGVQQRLYIHFPSAGARIQQVTLNPRRQISFQSFEKRKRIIVRKILLRTIRKDLPD